MDKGGEVPCNERSVTVAYSEAQKKATSKYKQANYKRIPLDVPITEYEAIKTHADARNEYVNGFIRRAIRETIARDNAQQRHE